VVAGHHCLIAYWTSYPPFGTCPPKRIKRIFIDRNDVLYTTDSGVTKREGTGERIASALTGEIRAFIPDPQGGTGGAEGMRLTPTETCSGLRPMAAAS